MSDAPHWPFCIRLVDGGDILFRPDRGMVQRIRHEMILTDREIEAGDIGNFIEVNPGIWLHGDVAGSNDDALRASIDSTSIILIVDQPKPAPTLTPEAPTSPPASAPLVFDELAFLGGRRSDPVVRRAPVLRRTLLGRSEILEQMQADLAALRHETGIVDIDVERFALAGMGWDDDTIADHHAEAAALLQAAYVGSAT